MDIKELNIFDCLFFAFNGFKKSKLNYKKDEYLKFYDSAEEIADSGWESI